MKSIDVKPTAEIVNDMAETLERYSRELRNISKKMIETDDISRASEAITVVSNCIANLRMDLLVTRPIREFLK